MRPPKGKQKLLDAAMVLFESQGYFSTTVEQITAQAGVSKGLVYNYFRSKEELLSALLEDATRRMTVVSEELSSDRSSGDSFSAFIDRFFHFLVSERRFLKLQLTLMLMPELQQIVAEPLRHRAEALLRTLTDWLRQAGCRRAKRSARLLLATLDGVALHYLSVYECYPLSTMKPQLIQLAQRMCADPHGDQP